MNKYREYTRVNIPWIKEIPCHWEVKPLFSVLEKKQIKNTNNQVQNVLSLSYGRIVRRDVESNQGLLPDSFETYQIVEQGDIILRLTDLQNDKRSLRVGLVKEKGIITSAYLCLRSRGKALSSYLYLLLHVYDLKKVFYGLGSGVRQSLKYEEMKRIPLLIPSLDEQEKIVRFVDYFNEKITLMIEKLNEKISLLKDYRSSLITQAVTKGLDPNVPMKDSGIEWLGEVPGHWKVAKLKYFAEHCARGITPFYVEDEENSIPVINQACIQSYGIKWEAVKYHDKSRTYNKGLIKAGDVLICSTGKGALGRVQVFPSTDGEYVADGHVTIVRTNQADLSNSYLRFLLSTPIYFEMMDNVWSSGSTKQTELNRSEILNMPIIVPPINEQREITNFLEKKEMEITKVLSALEKQLNFLDTYRSSLITAAVTGQIDVSDWKEAEEELETIS